MLITFPHIFDASLVPPRTADPSSEQFCASSYMGLMGPLVIPCHGILNIMGTSLPIWKWIHHTQPIRSNGIHTSHPPRLTRQMDSYHAPQENSSSWTKTTHINTYHPKTTSDKPIDSTILPECPVVFNICHQPKPILSNQPICISGPRYHTPKKTWKKSTKTYHSPTPHPFHLPPNSTESHHKLFGSSTTNFSSWTCAIPV